MERPWRIFKREKKNWIFDEQTQCHNATKTISVLHGILWLLICDNGIVFLFANQLIRLLISLHSIYLWCACERTSFENNKSTNELSTKKTNSGTKMTLKRKQLLYDVCRFIMLKQNTAMLVYYVGSSPGENEWHTLRDWCWR